MPGEDELLRRVVIAEARAVTAELQLSALRHSGAFLAGSLVDRDAELAHLRQVVEVQAAELEALRESLRAAETRFRQVTLETLARSVVGAIERSGRALGDRAIAAARAELRVDLEVDDGALGIATGPTAGGRSTLILDVRPLPPSPEAEATRRAVELVRSALLDLQSALDRDLGSDVRAAADRASAELGHVLATQLEAATLGTTLTPLATRLTALAASQPSLSEAARAVANWVAALGPSPGNLELRDLAAAVTAVAERIRTA